jgi:signal peptidase I
MSKIIWLLFLLGLIGFLTFGPIDTQFKKVASQYTGLTTLKIPVSGTGSMYPTFPKGKGKTPQELADELVAQVDMYVYPNPRFKIGRGDIVEFKNAKTDEIEAKEFGSDKVSGFIKRVIGLPDDTVEIRDGQVLINGAALKEPYTALARSTFGGESLADCTKLTIPQGKYLVLGDNRKASNDSRHDVGLIDEKDVGFILPYKNQQGIWDKNFRDTSNDDNPSSKIHLNKDKYLEFLNSIRQASGLSELKYQKKLEASANLRGIQMLKFNDFSFEASRSGYTIDKAFSDSGYWNPVKGESAIRGYYSSDELIEGITEFRKSKGVFTDKDIQEIGIAEVEGQINGCPTQVIVQHFAGFIPPNYPQTQIDSFKNGLANLKKVQSSWGSLKTDSGNSDFYQKNKAEIDRINQIIDQRITSLDAIVNKVTSNQWLSPNENNYLKEDEKLSAEQNSLAEKINKAIQGF